MISDVCFKLITKCELHQTVSIIFFNPAGSLSIHLVGNCPGESSGYLTLQQSGGIQQVSEQLKHFIVALCDDPSCLWGNINSCMCLFCSCLSASALDKDDVYSLSYSYLDCSNTLFGGSAIVVQMNFLFYHLIVKFLSLL